MKLCSAVTLLLGIALSSRLSGDILSFQVGDDDAFGGMQTANCGAKCLPGTNFNASSSLITLQGGGAGLPVPTLVNEAGMDQLTDEDQFIFIFNIPYSLGGHTPTAAYLRILGGGVGASGSSNDLNSGTGFGAVPLVISNGSQSINYGQFFPFYSGFDSAAENTVRRFSFDVLSFLVGNTGTLTATLDGTNFNTNDRMAFDYVMLDVEYTPSPVPEPTTGIALMLGVALIAMQRKGSIGN